MKKDGINSKVGLWCRVLLYAFSKGNIEEGEKPDNKKTVNMERCECDMLCSVVCNIAQHSKHKNKHKHKVVPSAQSNASLSISNDWL